MSNKRMWSTPKSIEQDKRQAEEEKSRSIRNELSEVYSIHFNTEVLKEGINHDLENLYTYKDDVRLEKEKILKQVENERLTERMANDRIEELDNKYNNLRQSTVIRLEALFRDYKNIYTKKSALSGSNLDDEDMKLLKSTIKLTEEDLDSLVTKHKRNDTMLRAIKGYAEDKNINIPISYNSEKVGNIDKLQEWIIEGAEKDGSYYQRTTEVEEHRNKTMDLFLKNI